MTTRTEQKTETWIGDVVGALCDPIIVMPGGWGTPVPDWINSAITMERLIENMKAAKGEYVTGTDTEAMYYISTASLVAPIGSDWTDIYMYLFTRSIRRHKKETEVPPDLVHESLNQYQQQLLDRLKRWIYDKRVNARKERERASRRELREVAAAEKQTTQPALFEF